FVKHDEEKNSLPMQLAWNFCNRFLSLQKTICFLLVWITLLISVALSASAQAPVVVATYEGVINPVSAEYVHDALDFAERSKAQALVIRLDTPGGLDTS
ncbi:MAG: hypothetical protein C4294_16020, partial [Nitrospiraceae bacterium]